MPIDVKHELLAEVETLETKIAKFEKGMTKEKEYLAYMKRRLSSLRKFLTEVEGDADQKDTSAVDDSAGLSEDEPRQNIPD